MKFETTIVIQFDNQQQLASTLEDFATKAKIGSWREVEYNKVGESLVTQKTKTTRPTKVGIVKSKI